MRFLVESHPAQAPTPDVFALLPAETARGKELDAQGVRLHLLVAADRSAAWQVFQVDSREELEQVMSSFPLHSYGVHTVTQLADEPAE